MLRDRRFAGLHAGGPYCHGLAPAQLMRGDAAPRASAETTESTTSATRAATAILTITLVWYHGHERERDADSAEGHLRPPRPGRERSEPQAQRQVHGAQTGAVAPLLGRRLPRAACGRTRRVGRRRIIAVSSSSGSTARDPSRRCVAI